MSKTPIVPTERILISADVADALASAAPVVALESTLISHGLPQPRNVEAAHDIETIVRESGACPATIAVVGGQVCVGLTADQLDRIATASDVRKLSTRDLALAVATGSDGATTVSATSHVAALVGIDVFATGGLGGVHRGWTDSWDESADLDTLSRTPITVVSAGVKSILDVPATLQRLETLGVAVVGFGTDAFPGFYLRDSGQRVDWRVDSEQQIAAVMRARAELSVEGALIVGNPIAPDDELDRELHDRVLSDALAEAERQGIHGQAITPFLLKYMVDGTEGRSLEANLKAVYSNAALAARISVAWAKVRSRPAPG
ncbi:MAG: pseudouridine-5-phosphate glycosidase [Pseudonocardiales bacterium]|nr:pseudouridine-5-phosphate glycosidase [Pseudonocardiales bacterium]